MNQSPRGDADLREELRGDADRVTSAAGERLQSEADSRKAAAASQVKGLSSALDGAARELDPDSPGWLRGALQQGARSLDQLAQSVERKDSRALVGEVKRFARESPSTFLAGCAAAGFAAARILKAGGAPGTAETAQQPDSHGHDPYTTQTEQQTRPMMAFSDGGGTASPVSPQNVRTSL